MEWEFIIWSEEEGGVSNNNMNKMMVPPTTATATDSRLRRLRGYHRNHRALHGEQQSLFENTGSSQIDDQTTTSFNQSSQQQPQVQLQRHSASWGTYASFFLLTQGIAVICIIGILIFCIRKHRHQMTRQRIASMAQSQGWVTVTMTTMRSSATPTAAAVGEIVDVGGGGQTSGNERVGNDARDTTSGLGAGGNNDISSSLTTGEDQICPYPPNNGVNDDRSENHPTPFDRFLTVSRTIGSTMLHPLRALRAAINNWATGSYDEVFLRQLMERMEVEREAAKENPKDRARRLKEAFGKAGRTCTSMKRETEEYEEQSIQDGIVTILPDYWARGYQPLRTMPCRLMDLAMALGGLSSDVRRAFHWYNSAFPKANPLCHHHQDRDTHTSIQIHIIFRFMFY